MRALSIITASILASTGPASAFTLTANVANSNSVAGRASGTFISRDIEHSQYVGSSSRVSSWVGVGFRERRKARGTRQCRRRLAMEDGGRVWNKCKERVELGTSGLMVSRVGNGSNIQDPCTLIDSYLMNILIEESGMLRYCPERSSYLIFLCARFSPVGIMPLVRCLRRLHEVAVASVLYLG